MRKLIVSSLLAVSISFAPACKEPDPNKFETHVERIKDPDKRSAGFSGLEQLTKTVVTAKDNDDLIEEFAQKVIPAFEEVWPEAEEQHETMLTLLRDVGHPAGSVIWSQAIELDGSADARKKTILALQGIQKAKATDSADAVIEELSRVIKKPSLDGGGDEEGGELREMLAETLGVLKDPKAVPVLIETLEQPREDQPLKVHREAATALGEIGDPSAVDALLAVSMRVPDAPTSRNISERVKVALAAIGEPAVPGVVKMLEGENEEIQKLAAEVAAKTGGEQQATQFLIQQLAAAYLGAIGSEAAVDELIGFMPKDDCSEGGKAEEVDEQAAILRAFIAQALGSIGSPKAAEALCACVSATGNPLDMDKIMEALGRVGGDKALECLLRLVETGKYDEEAVEEQFLFQPRWEAGRYAVLVAGPDDLEKVRKTFSAAQGEGVKEHLEAWEPGLQLLESCKQDAACYKKTLADLNADWFAREKAAYEVARLAEGDVEAAAEIARAYKVRDPAARVTMAWLPPKMLGGKKCPKCVEAYEEVLEAEKLSTDAQYQGSVLTARYTMAKLAGDPAASESGKAAGEAAGEKAAAPE